MENRRRKIEVFSAGCPACEETIPMVNAVARPLCEVGVLDMRQPAVAAQAAGYGIRRVPAVVIDGKLASCCTAIIHALGKAFAMFWEILWALILGFSLPAIVQAVVSKSKTEMTPTGSVL